MNIYILFNRKTIPSRYVNLVRRLERPMARLGKSSSGPAHGSEKSSRTSCLSINPSLSSSHIGQPVTSHHVTSHFGPCLQHSFKAALATCIIVCSVIAFKKNKKITSWLSSMRLKSYWAKPKFFNWGLSSGKESSNHFLLEPCPNHELWLYSTHLHP